MNFLVRPSKCFLFDALEKKLNKIDRGIGLDAASAGFKNRWMFKTDIYYGLDISLPAIKEGIKNYNLENTFGVLADLEKLNKLPENSVDLVVSTNTLYHLPSEKRLKAINHLSRITAPDGLFFCDLIYDHDFQKAYEAISGYFKDIEIIYYRNMLSGFYEKVFIKNGSFAIKSIVGSKVIRLTAWLISRLEYFTCRLGFLNKQALLICKNKKNNPIKNKFDLSGFPKLGDKIINLYEDIS